MKQSVLALLLFGVGIVQAQAQAPAAYFPPVSSRHVDLPAANLNSRVSSLALAETSINHMEYKWDGAKGKWALPPANVQVERDAKDRIIRVTSTDSSTGAPRWRNIITHDFNGVQNQTEVISQTGENGQWINVSRRQSTGNPNAFQDGFSVTFDDFSENWKNGAWEPWVKTESAFDEHSNPVTSTITLWENGTVIRLEKWSIVYTYDASNRVTELVSRRWVGNEKDYSREMKMVYTYTGAATSFTDKTLYDTYQTNGVNTSEYAQRNHQELDAQGRLVLREQSEWEKATQSWVILNRTIQSYGAGTTTIEQQARKDGSLAVRVRVLEKTDEKGQVAEWMVYTPTGTGWKLAGESQRYVRRYNAQNQLVQEVTQTNTEQAPDVFTNATMNTFMEATALASTPRKELNGTISLYPNPTGANASLQIVGLRGTEPVQVEVFNSVGQLVQRHRVTPAAGTCLVKMQQLHSGVYTIRMSNSAGTSTRRLVQQ